MIYLANAHRAELIPLTSILWLLDIFNRVLLSSSAVSMTVTPSSCQQFAILSFTKDSTFLSYSPGTYSYLMIPELSYFESHPFSLLFNEKEKCMQQIIRSSGSWTKRLIQSHSNQSVRGFLEGPYEGMPFHLKKSRHLLFLSGGIGVTPNLSILRHLQHQTHLLGSLGRLQFVWSLKQSDAELMKLVEITSTADALNHNKCVLCCDIFFTQANNHLMGYHRLDEESVAVNGLRLHYGRVDIKFCIREFMTQSRLEDETLEVITVFVSGPASMIEATLLSCNAISASQPRIRIDVQSESFCL